MKAVVMEIKKNRMIVLDQKGNFRNIKHDSISRIGDEINLLDSKLEKFNYYKKITAAAAVFLLVAGSGYGAFSYYTPYAYVDVDINPSIELVLNRYMKVLDLQGLNEDAKKIAPDKKEFKNKDMQNVIEKLIDNAKAQNIISKEKDNDILYTVASDDNRSISNISQNLEKISKSKLAKINNKYSILLENVSVVKHNLAKQQKISPGREILYEKLKEVKPDTTLEEVKDQPVRNTLKLIQQYRKQKQEDKIEKEKNNTPKINKKPENKQIRKQNKLKNPIERQKNNEKVNGQSNTSAKNEKSKNLKDKLNNKINRLKNSERFKNKGIKIDDSEKPKDTKQKLGDKVKKTKQEILLHRLNRLKSKREDMQ